MRFYFNYYQQFVLKNNISYCNCKMSNIKYNAIILKMLESRAKRSYGRSRIYTDPQQQHYSVDVRRSRYNEERRQSNPGDTLKQFQEQLSSMATKQNFKYKSLKDSRNMLKQKNKTLSIEMSNIKSDINQLKNKVILYKKENQIDKKLGLDLIEKVKSKTVQRNIKLPAISTPHVQNSYPYYQYPYPSYYPPYAHPYPKERDYSQDQSEQERQKPNKLTRKNLKQKKKMNRQQRQNNRIRLRKIMKKVFIAVAYVFFLKKLSKMIMSKRRIVFNKFWPDMFTKSTNGIRKWFSGGCKNFFVQMEAKSQVELPIQGDESQPVINQKKKTIKILVNILIECLEDASESEVFQEVSQIVHIFCKHGAFIDNGVLTPEELQTVCVSDVHGYLRLDKSLQKSQIINFLLMKIIIFNMLLQPWKYNEEKFNLTQNKQAYQNFYYVSSVFYQLIVDVQNRFIQSRHDQHIDIGNWRKLKSKFRIKCSPSLCHLQSNYQSGEMISGLISEGVIDSVFPTGFWKQQINTLESVLQKMHQKLRKVHAKFINQTYNYKDLGRFGQ